MWAVLMVETKADWKVEMLVVMMVVMMAVEMVAMKAGCQDGTKELIMVELLVDLKVVQMVCELVVQQVEMSLEGKAAPEFELEGSDGKKHTLAEYAGKTVIIYFYPRDNTPGCTKEACGFRDLSPNLAGLNAIVFGVSKRPAKSQGQSNPSKAARI